jgi:hypothetical protein
MAASSFSQWLPGPSVNMNFDYNVPVSEPRTTTTISQAQVVRPDNGQAWNDAFDMTNSVKPVAEEVNGNRVKLQLNQIEDEDW